MPTTDAPLRDLPGAWAQALYGPSGFYRQAAGPAGHFATSAQGLPGVDELLADLVALSDRIKARLRAAADGTAPSSWTLEAETDDGWTAIAESDATTFSWPSAAQPATSAGGQPQRTAIS